MSETSPIRASGAEFDDEGVQVLENIANIRVPVIAAVEGRAHIHSDYALLANVIVAAEGGADDGADSVACGLRLADCDFNLAALHLAYPIKRQPSAQRTQAS